MIFFNNSNQIYCNAILKKENFNLFTEWNFGASVRRDGWCEESYKIYWEDIAMIELILLPELNEAQPISWTAQTLKYFLIFLKIYSLVFIEWFYQFVFHVLSCFFDMMGMKRISQLWLPWWSWWWSDGVCDDNCLIPSGKLFCHCRSPSIPHSLTVLLSSICLSQS